MNKVYAKASRVAPSELDQDLLRSAFDCAIGGKVATYVSGPLTTGSRFIEWYEQRGFRLEKNVARYRRSLMRVVVKPNELAILEAVRVLRGRGVLPVLEPASLKIPSWEQREYHQFWVAALDRYVCRVIVLSGWQYSVGCVIEVNYAMRKGLFVEDLAGVELKRREVLELTRAAAEALLQKSKKLVRLRQIARALIREIEKY